MREIKINSCAFNNTYICITFGISIIFCAPTKKVYSVEGMMCGVACVNTINSTLKTVEGIHEFTIDEKLTHSQNLLMVWHKSLLDVDFEEDSVKVMDKLQLEYWNSYNEKHKEIFGQPYSSIKLFRKIYTQIIR